MRGSLEGMTGDRVIPRGRNGTFGGVYPDHDFCAFRKRPRALFGYPKIKFVVPGNPAVQKGPGIGLGIRKKLEIFLQGLSDINVLLIIGMPVDIVAVKVTGEDTASYVQVFLHL